MNYLKSSRMVHASGDTTAALRIHGHEFIGLQISKTGNATKRHVAVAISRIVPDHVPKIGIASLHVDETCLLRATQDARVVSDGWNALGTFGTRHIADSHFV